MNMQPQKDFSPLLNSDIPLYMQVYTYYKALITSGKLAPNAKLPSIRSSFPADSSREWPLQGHWLPSQRLFWLTSRPVILIPVQAQR